MGYDWMSSSCNSLARSSCPAHSTDNPVTPVSMNVNEKHLMLGVLAVERRFISLDQLTDAVKICTDDQSTSLPELLSQRGWLNQENLVDLERQIHSQTPTTQDHSNSTFAGQGPMSPALQKLIGELQDTGNGQALGTVVGSVPEFLESIGKSLPSSFHDSTRYTWVSEVGRGGLGQVWRAQDNELSREVALKEIKADSASEETVRRLIREAQITAQLQHPNIVPIYEVHRGARPFYTMKLVRGKTLAQAIQEYHELKRHGQADPIAMPRLITVFISICNALAYAHSRGIIHRDLKPQNIVLGDFGEAIVLDWGLARSLDALHESHPEPISPVSFTDDAQTDVTQAGATLGTPAYMAPEQAAGRVDLLDARTDVYGLGAILFQILTGEPPHRLRADAEPDKPSENANRNALDSHPVPTSDLAKLLIQISNGPTPLIRDVDSTIHLELDMLCARAMARNREDRFQTVNEFKAALLEFKIHEQSIELAAAAQNELKKAISSGKYGDYNRAMFGFEEALRQWPENVRAAEGDRETRMAFAKCAYARGDFDLAASLLDEKHTDQRVFRTTVQFASWERNTRHSRMRWLRIFCVAASLVTAVVASAAAFIVNQARIHAVDAREQAHIAQVEEARQRQLADAERQIADQQTKVAVREQQIAAAQLQRANQKSEEAREGLYVASLRLAGAQLQNQSIAFCNQTLQTSRPQGDGPDLRGWEWSYLWNQTHSELLTVEGHSHPVLSVHFSPDGKQFVSGGRDNMVRICETLTGKELRQLKGHGGWVTCVRFSHDGQRIVSSSEDKHVKIWDATSGQLQHTLTGHLSTVESVTFSPDDTRVISGGSDNTIRIWDSQTGLEKQTLLGHNSSVLSVAVSPDGQRIVSGSDDHLATVWDAKTGKPVQTFSGHSAPVPCVSFSPDGVHVVSSGLNGLICMWDSTTGEQKQTFTGHAAWIRDVTFTPTGRRIISASDDKTIKIWDVETGNEQYTLQGHTDGVSSVHVSLDDKRIVSGSDDKTVKVWDAHSGQQSLSLSGHVGAVKCVAFSPNSPRVVSGGIDQTVRVWDVHAAQSVMTLSGHTATVQGVAFSPDGRLIASASGRPRQPGELHLWNAKTGELILTFDGHADVVNCVFFTHDGKQLLSGSADRTLKLWDVVSGKLLRTMTGHSDVVTSISGCPHGRHWVSGSLDKSIRIWDARTGESRHTLTGHTEPVLSVSISQCGKYVVSGAGVLGNPGEVKIWDMATGKQTFSLQGHQNAVTSAVFSQDSNRILSASHDGRLKIWHAKSGQELLVLQAGPQGVTSCAFCRNDTHVLNGGEDGIIRLWDGTPETQAAERAIEREARTAITLWRARTDNREELIKALRKDPTLTSAALQKALDWIEELQK